MPLKISSIMLMSYKAQSLKYIIPAYFLSYCNYIILPIICMILNVNITMSAIAANQQGVTCTIQNSPTLDFGVINPYDTTAETTSVAVNVNCSSTAAAKVSYELTVSDGAAGNQTGRKLFNSANSMSYNMYIDFNYSRIFGNSKQSTKSFSTSYNLKAGGNRSDSFMIYGKIPVQTVTPMGTYTDSLILTLTY